MYIPWREFVGVKRARVDPAAAPLEPSKVVELGLVLSRFAFNGLPNLRFSPGSFQLEVRSWAPAFAYLACVVNYGLLVA